MAGVAVLFCALLIPSGGLTLRLDEIAPGIDLDAHVLSQVGFPVRVSDSLKLMDVELFTDTGTRGPA